MDDEQTIKLLGRFLFLIWFITLFFIGGYAYLANQGKLFFLENYFSTAIEINIIGGLVFVFLILLEKVVSKKTLFFAGVLVLFTTIIYVRVIPAIRSAIDNNSSGDKITEVKQFYGNIFFDVLGYPADQRMADSDELFNEVNKYRQEKLLSSLQKDDDLCNIAKSGLDQLYSLSETKNYDLTKRYPKMAEIIQEGKQPNLAKNIVRLRWSHLFSNQKEVLEDKNWTFGCSLISGYNVAFVFSYN